MEQQFRFISNDLKTALVILFPPGIKGLFNPEIHKLVREVEGQLNGVHVTYALSTGGSPDLDDAIAASRFAGCDAAVVVHPQQSSSSAFSDDLQHGDRMIDWSPVESELTAEAVAGTFLSVVDQAGKAA